MSHVRLYLPAAVVLTLSLLALCGGVARSEVLAWLGSGVLIAAVAIHLWERHRRGAR